MNVCEVSREDHLRRILNSLTLTTLTSREVVTVTAALLQVYRTNPLSFYGFPPDVPVSLGLSDAFNWSEYPALIPWARVHQLLVDIEPACCYEVVEATSVTVYTDEDDACDNYDDDDDDDDSGCEDSCCNSVRGWGLVDKHTGELAPVFTATREAARNLKGYGEKVTRVFMVQN